MSFIDKLIDRVLGLDRLRAQNERLRTRLSVAESAGSNWDREQELIGLREAMKRMTPQKQFRILAKGPCLPFSSVRETRFLDITSVASTDGVTTISVDAPWLTPKGGTP